MAESTLPMREVASWEPHSTGTMLIMSPCGHRVNAGKGWADNPQKHAPCWACEKQGKRLSKVVSRPQAPEGWVPRPCNPPQDVATWRAGSSGGWGTYWDYADNPDSIARLSLSARTQNALIRAGILSISLLIELSDMASPGLVRNMGETCWQDVRDALDRPFAPVEESP